MQSRPIEICKLLMKNEDVHIGMFHAALSLPALTRAPFYVFGFKSPSCAHHRYGSHLLICICYVRTTD